MAQRSDFSQLFVKRTGSDAVPTDAWTSDIDFRNGTSYFWRVRACSGTSIGDWSATGVFVIGDLPVATTTADGMPQNVAKQVQSTSTPTVTMTAVQTVLPPVMSVQFEMPGWAVITGAGIIVAVLLFLGEYW